MSAVLGIVRGHKGAIKVTSEIGRGTSFRLLFPAKETGKVDEYPSDYNSPTKAEFTYRPSGTVLVIDDEEPVREALFDILENTGLHVMTADNGRSGINLFQKYPFDIDLVILDHSMPGLNGEETFREIHRINPHARVIISSGYDRSEVTSQFADLGLAGFLQKPYSAGQLVEEVSRNLGIELAF